MKKINILIPLIILIVSGCISFEENKSEVIIGKWKLDSENYEVYTFYENKTVLLESYKYTEKIFGEWYIENNTLHMNFIYGNSGLSYIYKIKFNGRNTMILDDGNKYIYHRFY